MPVMMLADGAALSYIFSAANCENSRNGMPGSSSIFTRSRGNSLPRAVCFLRASSPPPKASFSQCARKSSTKACMACALAANSSERGLSLVSNRGIVLIFLKYFHRHKTTVHLHEQSDLFHATAVHVLVHDNALQTLLWQHHFLAMTVALPNLTTAMTYP